MPNFVYPQDPYAPTRPRSMADGLGQGVQTMFGGLKRGSRALNPYSNRLLAFGAGMLEGGPAGAAKGLIAGSELDRESADRRQSDEALQGLMNDPDSDLMAGYSQPEKDYLLQNPAAMQAIVAQKFGGTTKDRWSRLSDDTLYNAATGETKAVGGGTGAAGGPGSFLKGNSAEVQAVRWLIESGQLTEEEGAQWLASKTVVGSDGVPRIVSPDQLINAAKEAGMGGGGGGAGGGAGTTAGGSEPGTPIGGPKETTEQKNKVANAQVAATTVEGLLNRYEELVGKYGMEAAPGAPKDQLNTVRTNIMMELKTIAELGVLTGPDLSLMEKMIWDPVVDPTKEGGVGNIPGQIITGVTGGAGARAKSSADELRLMMKNKIEAFRNRGGGNTGGGGTSGGLTQNEDGTLTWSP